MVQWLRLRAFTAKGLGLIPDQGTKIPQATQRSQKNKTKQNPNLATLGQHSGMTILIWSWGAGQRLPALVPTHWASEDIRVYDSCQCT